MADPVQRLFTKIPALLAEAEALFSSDPDEKSLISTGLISQNECDALRAEVTLRDVASAAARAAEKTVPGPNYAEYFTPPLAALRAQREELRETRRSRENLDDAFRVVALHYAFEGVPAIAGRINTAAKKAKEVNRELYSETDHAVYLEEVGIADQIDNKTRRGTHGDGAIMMARRDHASLVQSVRQPAWDKVMTSPIALAVMADAGIVKEALEKRRNTRLNEIGKRLLVCLHERAEPVEN